MPDELMVNIIGIVIGIVASIVSMIYRTAFRTKIILVLLLLNIILVSMLINQNEKYKERVKSVFFKPELKKPDKIYNIIDELEDELSAKRKENQEITNQLVHRFNKLKNNYPMTNYELEKEFNDMNHNFTMDYTLLDEDNDKKDDED